MPASWQVTSETYPRHHHHDPPKESSAAVLPWKGHLVTMGTFGNGLGCRNAKRLQPDARQNDLRPTC